MSRRKSPCPLVLLFLASCGSSPGGDEPPSDAGAAYSLHVTVSSLDPGQFSCLSLGQCLGLVIAVRDTDSMARVKFVHVELPTTQGSYDVSWPGLLAQGHRYQVAITSRHLGSELCRQLPGMHVYNVDAVNADVTVNANDVDDATDPSGCQIVFTPVKLPAGAYNAKFQQIPGQQNELDFVASATGRLFLTNAFYDCSASCNGGAFNAPTCAQAFELFVFDDQTFLGGNDTNGNQIVFQGTIDSNTNGIALSGKVVGLNLSDSAPCCSTPVAANTVSSSAPLVCP